MAWQANSSTKIVVSYGLEGEFLDENSDPYGLGDEFFDENSDPMAWGTNSSTNIAQFVEKMPRALDLEAQFVDENRYSYSIYYQAHRDLRR